MRLISRVRLFSASSVSVVFAGGVVNTLTIRLRKFPSIIIWWVFIMLKSIYQILLLYLLRWSYVFFSSNGCVKLMDYINRFSEVLLHSCSKLPWVMMYYSYFTLLDLVCIYTDTYIYIHLYIYVCIHGGYVDTYVFQVFFIYVCK